MNKLTTEKRAMILTVLVEANSIADVRREQDHAATSGALPKVILKSTVCTPEALGEEHLRPLVA